MRVVIKWGTSTLAYKTGRPNIRIMERLCKTVSDLKNAGHEVIICSSGAIALGFGKLMLPKRPDDVPTKQASAAVGQCELMYTYDKLFSEYNHVVAQILLTGSDLEDEERHQNFRNTIFRLLELGAIPIINENDTVVTQEIRIGDNDTLGAIAAVSVEADLLVVLTDTDGLYTGNPHSDPNAVLIPVVKEITPEIEQLATGSDSGIGTGGMATKIHAAKIATGAGIDMVIINGSTPELLYTILEGGEAGTRFIGKKENQ